MCGISPLYFLINSFNPIPNPTPKILPLSQLAENLSHFLFFKTERKVPYNAALVQISYIMSCILCCCVTGEAECEVKEASENELQCILQAEEKNHIVTNQGSHHSRCTLLYMGFSQCKTKFKQYNNLDDLNGICCKGRKCIQHHAFSCFKKQKNI